MTILVLLKKLAYNKSYHKYIGYTMVYFYCVYPHAGIV